MPTYTTSGTNGDVLLSGTMPQAEYMYGCVPTATAMLLGYYDLYGYQGKDLSKIVDGTVALKSRGTDGNAYDMDAFDTVLGKLTASKEYVYRFYERDGKETTPEQELVYTFQEDNKTLKTDEWNCLADYLGTGQYWRNADNLVTLVSYCTLADLYNNNYSDVRIKSGDTVRMVRYNDTTMLPGLDLYVQSRGYQLDYEITGTFQVDVAGGSFTFKDYMNEIDSGRPVLISIQGHVMIGYGYNQKTQEIIFDDCYKADQRMKWNGTYFYADADRKLESITVIGFNVNGDVDLALVNTKSSQEKLTLTATAGGTGSEDYCVAGSGNTVYLNFTVSNLGKKKSGKFQASVYVDGQLFTSGQLDSLSANESRDVPVSLGKLSVGLHNVRVVLDEPNLIQEADGANNTEERSFLVLKAGTEVVTGNRQVQQDETVGDIYVHGGTLTVNGQASGVVLRGIPGKNSFWGARYQQGKANVMQGGCLSGATVYEYGEVNVSGGIAASANILSSGKLTVRGDGTTSDVAIESGGKVTVESGGKLTGRLSMASGANVSFGKGGIVNFDLSALSPSAGARVNVLSRITGTPVYTITVSGKQTSGVYSLAGGAAKFNQTISLVNTDGIALGELKLKKTLATNYAAYRLNLTGENLTLTVVGNKPPTVSRIRTNITTQTSRDVTVTAVFADDVGLEACLYRIGEDGEWENYNSKTGVTVTDNATVYFKAIDTGGNESEIGVCEVTNIDKSVLDTGKNNWLYNRTASPKLNPDENLVVNPLRDGVSEILLDEEGTVSKDGKHNFVGYGDPVDYAKIELDSPSRLSFTINASSKVLFVVYKYVEGVDGRGNTVSALNAIQTLTPAWNRTAGEYTGTTRSILLDKSDANTSYYISVYSLYAQKNGYALYNVELNQPGAITKFYVDSDNGDNNWLYDKKLITQGEKALNSKVTDPDPVRISAAGDEIRFDEAVVCEDARAGGWNNFVGFGDAVDFVKINLETTAKLSFHIESTDAAKIFICKVYSITDRKGKVYYSMKALAASALLKARGAVNYAADTKTLQLDADTDYYLAILSSNASKGGSAYYNVTVGSWTAVAAADAWDTCSLSMPEDDRDISGTLNPQDGLLAGPETQEPFPAASVPSDIRQDESLFRQDAGLLA